MSRVTERRAETLEERAERESLFWLDDERGLVEVWEEGVERMYRSRSYASDILGRGIGVEWKTYRCC